MGDKGKPMRKKQIKPAVTETTLPNTQAPAISPNKSKPSSKRKG